MHYLVRVTDSGILKCMKIELVKCSSDMQRGIVVYKTPQHPCVLQILLGEVNFQVDLRGRPEQVGEDGGLAPGLPFPAGKLDFVSVKE